jgi:hypothetical protein
MVTTTILIIIHRFILNFIDKSEGTILNWKDSIKYFDWEMEIGDFIMTSAPPEDNRCFLGIIQSGYFFANDNHHRKVD